MKIDFLIPEPDGNGDWDYTKASFLTSVELEIPVDVLEHMIEKVIVIEQKGRFLVLAYEYKLYNDELYIQVYVTKAWE